MNNNDGTTRITVISMDVKDDLMSSDPIGKHSFFHYLIIFNWFVRMEYNKNI